MHGDNGRKFKDLQLPVAPKLALFGPCQLSTRVLSTYRNKYLPHALSTFWKVKQRQLAFDFPYSHQASRYLDIMLASDAKSNMDSSTLKSGTPSFDEKRAEKLEEARLGSSDSTTADSTHEAARKSMTESHGADLKKIASTRSAKEVTEELHQIMTSGEGIEYPTGAKLGLISLALCKFPFISSMATSVSKNFF
jgi:hypothetical protein